MLRQYEQSSRPVRSRACVERNLQDMEQNSEDDPSIHSVAFKTVLLRAVHYVAKTFSSQASANVFAAVLRNIDYIALFL